MDKEKIKEKVLRWQLLAEQYFKENIGIFIKTINGDYHFCKVVVVGETKITVDDYAPEQRAGKRNCIEWLEIETLEKDKGVEVSK